MPDLAADLEELDQLAWKGGRRVRFARAGEALHLQLSEVTSQARIYKKTLDDFFRHELRDQRPRWGDYCVEILMVIRPGLPKIDLDNVAKAVLDGVKGAVFFDDAQVARLVVERVEGPEERVFVSIHPRPGAEDQAWGGA